MSFLPAGWSAVEIGNLVSLINGKAFKPSDWSTRGLPIVRIQNLNNPSAKFNYCDADVDERFIIENGSLLFAWSGTPGTSFGAHVWTGGRAVLNQHIFHVVFSKDHLDKHFLRLAINEKLQELIDKAHGGVGLRHVTKGRFEETSILLPPLAEQRRIVAKLDRLFARTARARAELARIPALVARYKQAILTAAFRGANTTTPLDELAVDIRYGTAKKCDYGAGRFPVLRIPNIAPGYIDDNDLKSTELPDTEAGRLALAEGDILLVRSNGSLDLVGRSAVVGPRHIGFLYAGYLIRIRLKLDRVDPRFVNLALSSMELRRQIESLAKSTSGVNNINGRQLASLPIPDLPLAKQAEVVCRIEAAFVAIDRMAGEAAQAAALGDRLDERLLAKAFRGELVPQDPDDEPAAVLLDRIRTERAATPKPRRGRRGAKNRAVAAS